MTPREPARLDCGTFQRHGNSNLLRLLRCLRKAAQNPRQVLFAEPFPVVLRHPEQYQSVLLRNQVLPQHGQLRLSLSHKLFPFPFARPEQSVHLQWKLLLLLVFAKPKHLLHPKRPKFRFRDSPGVRRCEVPLHPHRYRNLRERLRRLAQSVSAPESCFLRVQRF